MKAPPITVQVDLMKAEQMAMLIAAGQPDLIKQLDLSVYDTEAYKYLRSNIITQDETMLEAMLDVALIYMHTYEVKESVLVLGESGVGKESFARAFAAGRTKTGQPLPFVGINCTSLPDYLVESELFGHVKGSFTGAVDDRVGLMRQAGEGVLFIDEIGDMPLSLQPKLLRVLQERRVRPVGSNEEYPIRCRVVCATQSDPNKIRSDLFFRISQFSITIPPLRDRVGDVWEYQKYHNFTELSVTRELANWVEAGCSGNYRGLQNILNRFRLQTWRDSVKENK